MRQNGEKLVLAPVRLRQLRRMLLNFGEKPLALGDVLDRADHPERPAVVVVLGPPKVGNPPNLAVLSNDPELRRKSSLVFYRLVGLLHQPRGILRVQQLCKGLESSAGDFLADKIVTLR